MAACGSRGYCVRKGYSGISLGLMTRWPFFMRFTALVTLTAFLFTSVQTDYALAATPAPLPTQSNPAIIDASSFALPAYLGYVRDAFKSSDPGRPVVIHIQDAHCNYAAQHSIGNIIGYLYDKYSVKDVNLEGGEGGYDHSAFLAIGDEARRRKAADFILSDGEINGAELYSINNPGKVRLWGVEDTALYLKNLNVYRDALKHRDEIDIILEKMGRAMAELKHRVFSGELLDLDMQSAAFDKNNLEFRKYDEYLTAMAAKHSVDMSDLKNIGILNRTLELEKGVDFKRANIERDELIERLGKSLSRSEVAELKAGAEEYKAGRLEQAEFYAHLVSKSSEVRIDKSEYKALNLYIGYITAYAALNREEIFEEIERLESRLKDKLFRNDDEKMLDVASRALSIVKDIFGLTLTREGYEYYTAHKADVNLASIADSINALIRKHGGDQIAAAEFAKPDGYLRDMEDFFALSFKRDEEFVKNMKIGSSRAVKGMPNSEDGAQYAIRKTQNEPRSAILITGGFHTDNLTSLLKKKNISYVSIMPSFRDDGRECPYFKLLANGMSPLLSEAVKISASRSGISIYGPFNDNAKKVHPELTAEALAEYVGDAADAAPGTRGEEYKGSPIKCLETMLFNGGIGDAGSFTVKGLISVRLKPDGSSYSETTVREEVRILKELGVLVINNPDAAMFETRIYSLDPRIAALSIQERRALVKELEGMTVEGIANPLDRYTLKDSIIGALRDRMDGILARQSKDTDQESQDISEAAVATRISLTDRLRSIARPLLIVCAAILLGAFLLALIGRAHDYITRNPVDWHDIPGIHLADDSSDVNVYEPVDLSVRPVSIYEKGVFTGLGSDSFKPSTGDVVPSAGSGRETIAELDGFDSAGIFSIGLMNDVADGGRFAATGAVDLAPRGKPSGEKVDVVLTVNSLKSGETLALPVILNGKVVTQDVPGQYEIDGQGRLHARSDLKGMQVRYTLLKMTENSAVSGPTPRSEQLLEEMDDIPEAVRGEFPDGATVLPGQGLDAVRNVLKKYTEYSRYQKVRLNGGTWMKFWGGVIRGNERFRVDCDVAAMLSHIMLADMGIRSVCVVGYRNSGEPYLDSSSSHAVLYVEIDRNKDEWVLFDPTDYMHKGADGAIDPGLDGGMNFSGAGLSASGYPVRSYDPVPSGLRVLSEKALGGMTRSDAAELVRSLTRDTGIDCAEVQLDLIDRLAHRRPELLSGAMIGALGGFIIRYPELSSEGAEALSDIASYPLTGREAAEDAIKALRDVLYKGGERERNIAARSLASIAIPEVKRSAYSIPAPGIHVGRGLGSVDGKLSTEKQATEELSIPYHVVLALRGPAIDGVREAVEALETIRDRNDESSLVHRAAAATLKRLEADSAQGAPSSLGPSHFQAMLKADNPYYASAPMIGNSEYEEPKAKTLVDELVKNAGPPDTRTVVYDRQTYHIVRDREEFRNKPVFIHESLRTKIAELYGFAPDTSDKEFLDKLSELMEARNINLKGSKAPGFVFCLLDKSESLFENHTNDGFIGVNNILFEEMAQDDAQRVTILQALLETGLTHELAHEAGKANEDKITREDARLITGYHGINYYGIDVLIDELYRICVDGRRTKDPEYREAGKFAEYLLARVGSPLSFGDLSVRKALNVVSAAYLYDTAAIAVLILGLTIKPAGILFIAWILGYWIYSYVSLGRFIRSLGSYDAPAGKERSAQTLGQLDELVDGASVDATMPEVLKFVRDGDTGHIKIVANGALANGSSPDTEKIRALFRQLSLHGQLALVHYLAARQVMPSKFGAFMAKALAPLFSQFTGYENILRFSNNTSMSVLALTGSIIKERSGAIRYERLGRDSSGREWLSSHLLYGYGKDDIVRSFMKDRRKKTGEALRGGYAGFIEVTNNPTLIRKMLKDPGYERFDPQKDKDIALLVRKQRAAFRDTMDSWSVIRWFLPAIVFGGHPETFIYRFSGDSPSEAIGITTDIEAGGDQNLAIKGISEEDIRLEQERLINGGEAIAWNMENIDRIIEIIGQERPLTFDDPDKPDELDELIGLFDFASDEEKNVAKEKLNKNIGTYYRYRLEDILPVLKKQRAALGSILDDTEKASSSFIDKESVVRQAGSLKSRRYVLFLSKDGLFARGDVLGHSSANKGQGGSIYMHSNTVSALPKDALELVMLHENNDAARQSASGSGSGHRDDIRPEEFDRSVKASWQGLRDIDTMCGMMGRRIGPQRDLCAEVGAFCDRANVYPDKVLDMVRGAIVPGTSEAVLREYSFFLWITLAIRYSDDIRELGGNLEYINEYLADVRDAESSFLFVYFLRDCGSKVEYAKLSGLCADFNKTLIDILSQEDGEDDYQTNAALQDVFTFLGRLRDLTGAGDVGYASIAEAIRYITEALRNAKDALSAHPDIIRLNNSGMMVTHILSGALEYASERAWQQISRTDLTDDPEFYKQMMDLVFGFVARNGASFYDSAYGRSYGFDQACTAPGGSAELRNNLIALDEFLKAMGEKFPLPQLYSKIDSLMVSIAGVASNDPDNRLSFAEVLKTVSDIIHVVDSQDALDLINRYGFNWLLKSADKLTSPDTTLSKALERLAMIVIELCKSGMYLQSVESYIASLIDQRADLGAVEVGLRSIVKLKEALDGTLPGKSWAGVKSSLVGGAAKSVPIDDLPSTVDAINKNVGKIAALDNEDILRLTAQNFKDLHGVIADEARTDIFVDLARSGFIPTSYMVDYIRQGHTVDDLNKVKEAIGNGGFLTAANTRLFRDVEYTHYVELMLEAGFDLYRAGYEGYYRFLDAPDSTVNLTGAVGTAEIDYAIYEAIQLLGYIEDLKRRLSTQDKEVIVVANMSYGGFVVDIIEEELQRLGIKVIRTKIGSTESHENPWVFRQDLFSDEDMRYMAVKDAVVVVVDGTEHLIDRDGDGGKKGRYPDAYQGYRSFVLALNEAISRVRGDAGRSYLEDVGKDESFLDNYTDDFLSLVDTLRGMVSDNREYYKFRFWNPSGIRSILRENRQSAGEVESSKPEDIVGRCFIFANAVMEDGSIPRKLKEFHKNPDGSAIVHQPGHWDDNEIIKQTSLSVTSRGVVHEKKLKPIMRERYKTVAPLVGRAPAVEPSPFGKAELTEDGRPQFVAHVDDAGKVVTDFDDSDSKEFREWNERHEGWHIKLGEDHPNSPAAAREIAAIALAFDGMKEVKDAHINALLKAMGELEGRAPPVTDESFLSGIAKLITQLDASRSLTLKNQILKEREYVLEEAMSLVFSGIDISSLKPVLPENISHNMRRRVLQALRDGKFLLGTLKKMRPEVTIDPSDITSIVAVDIGDGRFVQALSIKVSLSDGNSLSFALKIAKNREGTESFGRTIHNLNYLNRVAPDFVPKIGIDMPDLALWSEEYVNTTGMTVEQWRISGRNDAATLDAIEQAVARDYWLMCKSASGYIKDAHGGNIIVRETEKGFTAKIVDVDSLVHKKGYIEEQLFVDSYKELIERGHYSPINIFKGLKMAAGYGFLEKIRDKYSLGSESNFGAAIEEALRWTPETAGQNTDSRFNAGAMIGRLIDWQPRAEAPPVKIVWGENFGIREYADLMNSVESDQRNRGYEGLIESRLLLSLLVNKTGIEDYSALKPLCDLLLLDSNPVSAERHAVEFVKIADHDGKLSRAIYDILTAIRAEAERENVGTGVIGEFLAAASLLMEGRGTPEKEAGAPRDADAARAAQVSMGDVWSESKSHEEFYYWLESHPETRGLPIFNFDPHNDMHLRADDDQDVPLPSNWLRMAWRKGYVGDIYWVIPSWIKSDGETILSRAVDRFNADPLAGGRRVHLIRFEDAGKALSSIDTAVLATVDADFFANRVGTPEYPEQIFDVRMAREVRDKICDMMTGHRGGLAAFNVTHTGMPFLRDEDAATVVGMFRDRLVPSAGPVEEWPAPDGAIDRWIMEGSGETIVRAEDGREFLFRYSAESDPLTYEDRISTRHIVDVYSDNERVGFVHFMTNESADASGRSSANAGFSFVDRGLNVVFGYPRFAAIYVDPGYRHNYSHIGTSLMGFAMRVAYAKGVGRFGLTEVLARKFFESLGFQISNVIDDEIYMNMDFSRDRDAAQVPNLPDIWIGLKTGLNTSERLQAAFAGNPELAGMDEIKAFRAELETALKGEPIDTARQEAENMADILLYEVGVYAAAKEVMSGKEAASGKEAVPGIRPSTERKTIFMPVSEKFCPTDTIVFKTGASTDWTAVRNRLYDEYNFDDGSVTVVFYDGTVEGLKREISRQDRPIDPASAFAYIDKDSDRTGLEGLTTMLMDVDKAQLAAGKRGYFSVTGHVVLALGVLEARGRPVDIEYLKLIADLMGKISGDTQTFVANEEFLDDLKDGRIVLMLKPVDKIPIDKNMKSFFAAVGAIGRSL